MPEGEIPQTIKLAKNFELTHEPNGKAGDVTAWGLVSCEGEGVWELRATERDKLDAYGRRTVKVCANRLSEGVTGSWVADFCLSHGLISAAVSEKLKCAEQVGGILFLKPSVGVRFLGSSELYQDGSQRKPDVSHLREEESKSRSSIVSSRDGKEASGVAGGADLKVHGKSPTFDGVESKHGRRNFIARMFTAMLLTALASSAATYFYVMSNVGQEVERLSKELDEVRGVAESTQGSLDGVLDDAESSMSKALEKAKALQIELETTLSELSSLRDGKAGGDPE